MPGLNGVLDDAMARMRALGVVRQAAVAMKAFLLAAGVGSRLRPMTDAMPKCMVEIDGRPLLDIWLDAFERAGVDEVHVNLHHLPRRGPAPPRGADGAACRLDVVRADAARERRHARREPGVDRRRGDVPCLQRRQPH